MQREWCARNPEKVEARKQMGKDKRSGPRRPLQTEEEKAESRKAALRRAYLKHRERRLQDAANWRKSNPAKCSFYGTLRSRRTRQATPPWADKVYMEMWYELARADSQVLGVQCHVDHIIPLVHPKVCGLHSEDNLQVLTATDNLLKSNKWVSDWDLEYIDEVLKCSSV